MAEKLRAAALCFSTVKNYDIMGETDAEGEQLWEKEFF